MSNNILTSEDISSLFIKAMKLKEKNKFKESLSILNKLYKANETEVGIPLMIGYCFNKLGDIENAVNYYNKATKISPSHELASLGLFHSLWDLNKRKEAYSEARRFLKLVEYSEEYEKLFSEIEEGYRNDKNNYENNFSNKEKNISFNELIDEFNIIQQDITSKSFSFNDLNKRINVLIRKLKLFLNIETFKSQALIYLGKIYQSKFDIVDSKVEKINSLEESINYFDKLENSFDKYFFQGCSYFYLSKLSTNEEEVLNKSIQLLKEANKILPDYFIPIKLMGVAYLFMSLLKNKTKEEKLYFLGESIKNLSNANKMIFKNYEIITNLALVYSIKAMWVEEIKEQKNSFKTSFEYFERVLKISPDDYKVLFLFGYYLNEYTKIENSSNTIETLRKAQEYLEKAYKIEPDNEDILSTLGEIYCNLAIKQNDRDLIKIGINFFEKAIRKNKNDYKLIARCAAAYSEIALTGDDEEFSKYFQKSFENYLKALEISPNKFGVLALLGNLFFSSYKRDKNSIDSIYYLENAINYLREALILNFAKNIASEDVASLLVISLLEFYYLENKTSLKAIILEEMLNICEKAIILFSNELFEDIIKKYKYFPTKSYIQEINLFQYISEKRINTSILNICFKKEPIPA